MKTAVVNLGTKIFVLILMLTASAIYAGTTGKISGRVIDADTKEPVVGANIVIEGTYHGAAADYEGYYYINNIPPGEYRAIVTAVGYQKTIVENITVKIDLTTKLEINLHSSVVSINKEIVVQAERPLVTRDLTSTSVTISSKDIKLMPVESVGQLINLQAGVIDGHFRGGRSSEVAYLIDGVSVTDPFNGGFGLQVQNSSIREMEVISGTFNAEYGQAMSGIVNIVTQEGASKLSGSASAYVGNYITDHTDVFDNLGKVSDIKSRDFQFSLSGPAYFLDHLSFFVTGRYFKDDGYLWGKRVYNVTDNVPFFPIAGNKDIYINRNTGDGAYIPMNPSRKYALNGKIAYSLPQFKISYSAYYDDNFNKYYDHSFAWTPDGIMSHYSRNLIHSLSISHVPSQSTF